MITAAVAYTRTLASRKNSVERVIKQIEKRVLDAVNKQEFEATVRLTDSTPDLIIDEVVAHLLKRQYVITWPVESSRHSMTISWRLTNGPQGKR